MLEMAKVPASTSSKATLGLGKDLRLKLQKLLPKAILGWVDRSTTRLIEAVFYFSMCWLREEDIIHTHP